LPGNPAEYAEEADKKLQLLVSRHLEHLNKTYELKNDWSMLYRVFFYDAKPYTARVHSAIDKKNIDFGKSNVAQSRLQLFDKIKSKRNFALRLGQVARQSGWRLHEETEIKLIKKEITIDELKDEDFSLGLRQKGVDMRIGIDIATLALKQQANIIILVSGDSDFVSAAKLARREGVEFILDPLQHNIKPDLFEHIDGLYSGLTAHQGDSGRVRRLRHLFEG
jgi:uncharacterized LabA/DUF88 family protein